MNELKAKLTEFNKLSDEFKRNEFMNKEKWTYEEKSRKLDEFNEYLKEGQQNYKKWADDFYSDNPRGLKPEWLAMHYIDAEGYTPKGYRKELTVYCGTDYVVFVRDDI